MRGEQEEKREEEQRGDTVERLEEQRETVSRCHPLLTICKLMLFLQFFYVFSI